MIDRLASSPAFCPSSFNPHFLLNLSKPTAKTQCTCSANSNHTRPQSLSRRSMLASLGALAIHLFTPSSANAKPTESDSLSIEKEPGVPLTGFVTRSGIKFFDFDSGEGPTPKWGDLVNIQYVLYTLSPAGDSLVLQDSSYGYGKDGYLVHHGNGQSILGMEEVIHTMRLGGRRRAIIPANLAYTDIDMGPVPAWQGSRTKFTKALKEGDGTVVLDIEIRKIFEDLDSKPYYEDLTPSPDQVAAYLEDRITSLE